jgi:hypothetical protein
MAMTVDSVGLGRSGIGGGMVRPFTTPDPAMAKPKKTVKKNPIIPVAGGTPMASKPQTVTVPKKAKKPVAMRPPKNANDFGKVPKGLKGPLL